MNLLFVTQTYPYDGAAEESFIDPELAVLAELLHANPVLRAFIAPLGNEGKLVGKVPPSMEVVDWLLPRGRIAAFAAGLKRPEVYRCFAETIVMSRGLDALGGWLRRYGQVWDGIARNLPAQSEWLFYTYWFDGATSALVDYSAASNRKLRVVTRTHGIDCFDERAPHPRRKRDLAKISGVYSVSQAGAAYLSDRYGCPDHVFAQYLGVTRWSRMERRARQTSTISVASCASLIPLKRIPLLAEALVLLASRKPDIDVRWTHFGSGPQEADVRRVLAAAPANLKAELKGVVANAKVREALHQDVFDVFVNVSESEGLPVSLMEAAEAGIALIATDVGGNKEIVRDGSGVVLSANTSVEEIAAAILKICGPDQAIYAANAAKAWDSYFDADKNHHAFYRRILAGK